MIGTQHHRDAAMRVAHPAKSLGAALLLLAACGESKPDTSTPGGPRMALNVAPLNLPGIVDATYRVRVTNGDDEDIWTRELTSERFGNGRGDISYVGPCDSDSNPNRVYLEVLSLSDANGPLATTEWQNPAEPGSPVMLEVVCVENADTPVTFNLTIMRPANQGFFDIAVNFDEIFCSGKFDCQYPDGPIKLLFDPETDERAPTMVMAFACTAGNDSPTWLWLQLVKVTCANGETYVLDPSRGPGNAGAYPPLFYQTGVYLGDEMFQDFDKCYWNMAFGVDVDHLATIPGGCTLHVHATASDEPFVNGVTPAGSIYPVVHYEVPFTASNGNIECGPNQNPMNGSGSHVQTDYTEGEGFVFDFSMQCGSARECNGLIPGVANEQVKVRQTSEGVIVSVGTVSSAFYQMPSTLPAGTTVGGLGTECCVDPCCAQ
jgi:hypothetical protein